MVSVLVPYDLRSDDCQTEEPDLDEKPCRDECFLDNVHTTIMPSSGYNNNLCDEGHITNNVHRGSQEG